MARCRGCGATVVRAYDSDTGLRIDLDPTEIPATEPIALDAVIFEHHKTGWHSPALNTRRGFPLHHLHTHTNTEHQGVPQ